MVRKFGKEELYVPVTKYNDARYRTNFDKVPILDDGRPTGMAYWSVQDYDYKPTTEEVCKDVRKYTIQRYINEGLTPPAPEDIDVSAYVID